MNLSRIGEDRLLARILPRLPRTKNVINAVGEDCAIVDLGDRENFFVLKTDCVVEGVHFRANTKAVDVGWKAMARPLSDFAATSALPQFALITLISPAKTNADKIEKIYRGLNNAARKFGVAIVGGETSATPGPLSISVSVFGFVEKNRWTSRRRGKIGDDLFVTGRLGASDRGKHLRFVPRIEEARWLTKNFSIHAMMDLSDGLGADLPRLARASKTGFKIERKSLPLAPRAKIENAISDGEDYELLFAISPRHRDRLQKAWRKKFSRILLTRIGSLVHPSSFIPHPFFRGYVHFQKR